jgi:uncharacterized protein CbrC (UPF0167 family)
MQRTMSVHTHNGGNCDGCGKVRKTLYVGAINPWDGIVEAVFCFLCVKEGERYEEKMREEYWTW